MKVLCVNKFYFIRGGAEKAFLNTIKMLEGKGHDVVPFAMKHELNLQSPYERYFVSNIDYDKKELINNIKGAANLLYSAEARVKIKRLIDNESPDVAHLFNIYHHLSPSILYPLKCGNIPVILTINDYKTVCASYLLFDKGEVCEACRGGKYYECFLRGCVKGSRAKSLLNMMEMYLHHNVLHVHDLVDFFIAPSIFVKNKLEEMGLKSKVLHLPHAIDTKEFTPQYKWEERSVVYFGRLSREKGLVTLIDAMKKLDIVSLKIIGDGPMKDVLQNKVRAEKIKNVRFLGFKSGSELKNEICKSMAVILPSECYEVFGLCIIESFALGKPVIGARIGGIPELINENVTGVTFEPGNGDDLYEKIVDLTKNPDKIVEMGKNGRLFVEQNFNVEELYPKLIAIYQQAIQGKRKLSR